MATKTATAKKETTSADSGGGKSSDLARLREAVRRIATGQNVTEEQQEEILWLIEGKDPAKELAKRATESAEG